jgi:outer membrane receptor protein involved in Fe transport
VTAVSVCRALLAAWLVVFALGGAAVAQTSAVTGSLVDESGAVVPGATVTLTAPPTMRETVSDSRGEYRFANVAAGAYQLSATLSGFSAATQTVTVAGADLAVPPIVLTVAAIGEAIVVTAARSEQALVDSPAAMTVIPAAEIRTSPAQNYGDLLRSVPGLNVIQLSARDVNVTGRQATNSLATSQIALVDGRSLYLDFYGLILWDTMSVDPANIKQIEVVRGPASAVWGANALTGVVNIITKTPREMAGTTRVVLSGGMIDRDAGSSEGREPGGIFGAGVTTAATINDRWSYMLSAGYFNSGAYARPAGQIPVITDPRDPSGRATVGGATYPRDGVGPFGTAYVNTGSSQPKFDARFDHDGSDGSHLTLEGGTAGTTGTIFTGTGPFKIEPGSMFSFGRMRYSRGALSVGAFVNTVNAEADNQLLTDPLTTLPIQLNFKTQTYDVDASHRTVLGGKHVLSYGGNYRRNVFDVTLAPDAKNRNEIGAYLQDESAFGPVRVSLGARVDKFGNLPDPVFSPRLSVMYQPVRSQSFRVSMNRAFRSPSAINNYLDELLVTPVDLSPLAPLLPPPLQPAATSRFPLVVKAVGSEIPINGVQQPEMTQEKLTAYEWAYMATIRNRSTVGVAFYVNDFDHQINFIELPRNFDPYTAANPPPGWPLPPIVLTQMAQLGIYLPRTAFTYRNLGPTRQKGVELSLDHRFAPGLSASTNYSWQGDPSILDDPEPYPFSELSLPPSHRFNASATYEGPRYLGSLSANYSSRAFWADVLTPAYHGYTSGYTLVNLSAGVKFRGGRMTALVKSTNLINKTIHQHIFGDLLRRSVIGEIRIEM